MAPTLLDGDIVYLKETAVEKLSVNDFLVIKVKNKLVTHRIIYKSENKKTHLITKGDNNLKTDGKISPKDIIGKVVSIKRYGKKFNPENIYLYQSSVYFKEIVKIKNLFDRFQIKYVILKGLPIHLFIDKTHPKRFYVDCDILIDRRNFGKAKSVLRENGYKQAELNLSRKHSKMRDKLIETSYYKSINKLRVIFDIHLEPAFLMTQLGSLNYLYPQELIDKLSNELLKNKRKFKIFKEEFTILNNDYLFIYLAIHLFHHNFRGYYRYELLKNLISKKKLDFKFIAEEIKYYKLQNFIFPVVMFLMRYYMVKFPRKFMADVQSKAQPDYVTKINIFEDEPRLKSGIERFRNIFYLSPLPIYKKILVFLNKQVLYSIYWVIRSKIFLFMRFLRRSSTSFSA